MSLVQGILIGAVWVWMIFFAKPMPLLTFENCKEE